MFISNRAARAAILCICAAFAFITIACDGDNAAAPRFAAAPRRICSVNLGADEILYELVGVERVVAVNVYVDDAGLSNVANLYPDHIPRVRAELEKILSLEPDLVCVNPYNAADFLDVLQKSGRPYFRHDELTSIEGIENCIRALGHRVGEPRKAEEMIQTMETRLARVDEKLLNLKKKPRVVYWAASWTMGSNTSIDEIIRRAGGINAGAENGRFGSYEIAVERMLALDPDILLLDARDSLADLPGRALPPQLLKMRACAQGRVVRVPGRALTALSQHIVSGVEILAKELHPERFGAARAGAGEAGDSSGANAVGEPARK